MLLEQLETLLHVQIDLMLPPGQPATSFGTVAIPSGGGFQLRITATDTCYLYVFHIDSRDNVSQLFPNPEASKELNPLAAGRAYLIPQGSKSFVLDRNAGSETLHFVGSRWPAKDVEALFDRVRTARQPAERAKYRQELVARFRAREHASTAGVRGVFYKEYAFRHE